MMAFPLLFAAGSLPLLAIFDNLAAFGVVLIVLAPTVFLSIGRISSAYISLFGSIARPLMLVLVLPACYLLFQILPLQSVAHPAWESAASALKISLSGAISVDIGATILSFCKYCAFCGLLIASIGVAITRSNAERLLIISSVIATIVLLIFLLFHRDWAVANSGNAAYSGGADFDFGFIDSMAIIFAIALSIDLLERYSRKNQSGFKLIVMGIVTAACAAVALMSLVEISNLGLVVASGVSLLLFLFIILVRRFGGWVVGAPTVTMLMVIIIFAINGGVAHPDLDATLRFAPKLDLSMAQRMVEDAPIFGTGTGTFGKLEQVYRSANDVGTSGPAAPLSAVMAVEIGKVFFWITAAGMFAAILFFLVRAVARGRSWIYPAAAASLLCSALILMFSISFRTCSLSLMIGALGLGLGIAQSFSK